MTAGAEARLHRGRRTAPTARVARLWWYAPIVASGIGVAVRGPIVAVLAVVAALALLAMLRLRTWVWVAGAISITTLSEVLTRAGLLPDVVTFADFAFVYLGVLAALLQGVRAWTPVTRRLTAALAALVVVACLSAVLGQTEALRPLVTFGILAEPFALVLLLVLKPPSERERHWLLLYFGALVVLQLPFAVSQATTLGLGDPVKGTLTGAHTMAGFTVVGGLALLSWGYDRSSSKRLACTAGALPFLVLVPVLTDAKQVTFSLPAAALVFLASTRKLGRKVVIGAVLVGALVFLLVAVPAGKVATRFLTGSGATGYYGKVLGLQVALDEISTEWTYVVFGLGPANGLSRIAYLTSDANALRGTAPLSRLHLAPAPVPLQAQARAKADTSFNIPESSAFGIFTDLGVIGLLAYLWVIGAIVIPLLRNRRDWLARAALAGWALSLPLAFTFDWWEEPPFMLPLAMLTGLAIANATISQADSPARSPATSLEEVANDPTVT
jgi:hypothetical protein